MAKLEIPSIVVHNGSTNNSPAMERSARTQRTLSKQAEFDEDSEFDAPISNKSMDAESGDQDLLPSVPVNNNNTVHRARSQSKVKLLVRSHAVREETSPPPDPPATPEPVNESAPTSPGSNNNNNIVSNSKNELNNTEGGQNGKNSSISNGTSLSVTGTRHKLRREGSSQGSMDSNWSGCLSRGSSMEQQYTDGTGVDLEQFITDTLNRNQKDRMFLLKIEHELVSLVKDTKRSVHKFPPMSSYQRMLVHRVAAYFGMDHNVDTSGHQVVVNRTKATRIPDSRFRDHVRDDMLFPEEPRRSILKRDSSSFEETCFKSPDRQLSNECRRSKSFEEREEEYEKARRRIFSGRDSEGNEDCSRHNSQDEDDLRWSVDVQPWTCTDSETTTHTHSKSQSHCHERPNRLLKVESYESKDTLRANSLRLSVSKSYSFGGYDQQNATNTAVLTKQDSGSSMSSRLSPSSSGYKSQSQRSDATISATPSPTATPNLATQLSSQSSALSPEPESAPTVMWAVTSIAAVPPGSVLINPQTGRPYTNSDGSIYHFDPDNPPKMELAGEIQSMPQPPSVKPYQNETGNEMLCNGDSEGENKTAGTSGAEATPLHTASATTTTTTTVTTTGTSTSIVTTTVASTIAVTHSSSHVISTSQSSQTATCSSQTNLPDSVQSNSGSISLQPSTQGLLQPTAHAPPQPVLYPVTPHPPLPPAQYNGPNPNYPQPALCPYNPGSYNFLLQGPPPPPPPPPPHIPMPTGESVFPPGTPVNGTPHPLVYGSVPPANQGYAPAPNGSLQPPYEQRLPVPDGSGPAHDLNGYMMGINLGDSSRHGMPSTTVYWPPVTAPAHPPAHISQGQSQSVPIYYAPPQPAGHNATRPPYQPAACSSYSALPSVDRSGSGYGGSDCTMNFQPLHTLFFPTCSSNQNAMPTGPNGYCGAGGGSNSSVVVQFPPNTVHGPQHPSQPYHKAPTPPNTPQGLCPPYTVFGNGYGLGGVPGCLHYPTTANAPPPHQLPMPPTLRPPNLNLPHMAVRSSPPLRNRCPSFGGNRSPALKERPPAIYPVESNKPPHATSSVRFTTPPTPAPMPQFYGLPVMPGDVRLMGNGNRLPVPLPVNSSKPLTSHTRKQRAKPSAVVASRSGTRPILGLPNQQQPPSLGIPPYSKRVTFR